jgi:hypothetical protein
MFLFQLLAIFLLVFAGLCFFGPQLVIYGPRSFAALFRRFEARFVAGALVSAMVFVATVPMASHAVVTGGEKVLIIALETMTLSFGLI